MSTITAATVTMSASAFEFSILWNPAPDFAGTDAFNYRIMSPDFAAGCCAPFGNWSAYAGAHNDYNLYFTGDHLELYAKDVGVTAAIPFTQSGSSVTFSVPFEKLSEPLGLYYFLEHTVAGRDSGDGRLGFSDGSPAIIPGAVPLPDSFALMLAGLLMFASLLGRTGRRA